MAYWWYRRKNHRVCAFANSSIKFYFSVKRERERAVVSRGRRADYAWCIVVYIAVLFFMLSDVNCLLATIIFEGELFLTI